MRRFRKPKCPYCGGKLNYAQSWTMKRRGEYICPKCGGISNVVLDPLIYGLGFLTVLSGAIFFIVGLAMSIQYAKITLGGIFAVFLLLFLVAPFLVRLRKPGPPKRPPQPRGRPVRREPPSAG